MEIKEAENKIYPFIYDYHDGYGCHIKCKTTECMAWKKEAIYIGKPNRFGLYKEIQYSQTEGYCVRLGK